MKVRSYAESEDGIKPLPPPPPPDYEAKMQDWYLLRTMFGSTRFSGK